MNDRVPVCSKCQQPLSTQDQASYGTRCENCYTAPMLRTSGGLSAALRNMLGTDRHFKTCRNSIRSGG
jgi:hypothetical protein